MATLQRLAAYALVIDTAGRVLLSREPAGRQAGPWLLPGGGVEHDEHPEQAVIREVREETGLEVRVGVLREVLSDVVRVGRRKRPPHTVRLIYIAAVVLTDLDSPADPLSQDARWCTRQECRTMSLEPFAAKILDGSRA